MTISRIAVTTALCVASAAGGIALGGGTAALAGSHSGATSPATSHYLKGAYVLADSRCPKGTVAVNAEVRALTNSASGHSTFTLCYVK